MFRLLAPAGAPISLSAIFKAVGARLGGQAASERINELVKGYTGVKHCFFFNSGRTALTYAVRALSLEAAIARNEIVMPAYTCFSVPAAVARSGMKVRLVDVDPLTLDYQYDELRKLNFDRVLAIMGCNLLGIPSDWEQLRAIANQRGVFLIDDAAQAMGSKSGGRPVGTNGDIGFFSLGRGKNLTTYAGGILLVDDDKLAEAIVQDTSELTGGGLTAESALVIKTLLLSMFLKPRCYWFPAMMPFLGLGETEFDETFEVGTLSRFQRCLGGITWSRLDEYNAVRVDLSLRLARGISQLKRFHIPGCYANDCPAYLRFPVLAADRNQREQIIAALKKAGVSASKMYPGTINCVPGMEPYLAPDTGEYPGACEVVNRIFTLPTHAFVEKTDVERILKCLNETP